MYPRILSIAGSDSGGGAGIQADIKTFTTHHCFGATVITALTAQNTQGVSGIFPISNAFIEQQLNVVLSDFEFDAVKIGMIQRADIADILRKKIQQYDLTNIVIDPVMVATSGDRLIDDEAIDALKQLIPFASLMTPNIYEAEKLMGDEINDEETMVTAATHLAEQFKTNALIKGGHLKGEICTDVLVEYPSLAMQLFNAKRVDTNNTHGTGCVFSAAITANIGHNLKMLDAITEAKTYITDAITNASKNKIGQGNGPVVNFKMNNLEQIAADL